jgi:hypothetical protein
MTSNIGTSTLEPILSFHNPKPCIPWSRFLCYWKRKYSKLQVRKPASDICAQCFIFSNQHKYGANKCTSDNSNTTGVEEEAEDTHAPHQMTQCMRLYSRKKTRKSRRIEFFKQPNMLKQLANKGS